MADGERQDMAGDMGGHGLRFLVAECEPPEAREERRESAGRSSGERYVATLLKLAPHATCDRMKPADGETEVPDRAGIAAYDAVFLTGSPLHLYEETPEVRREVHFMREVFASGTPSFGSCAGLQLATVAAGGTVRPLEPRQEAGFARRITPTDEGRGHPLLAGRPRAFDAPAIHSDEVATLPADATLLASNAVARVQAAEIRHDGGVFWGVQYHPELPLDDIAAALRRQADELVDDGLARSDEAVERYAASIEALGYDRSRRDLTWQLGLDDQVIDDATRCTELRNFIEHLVKPVRAMRRREAQPSPA